MSTGCGKSSLAKTIIGIEDITGGAVFIDDKSVDLPRSEKCGLIQMIFQDPYNSLNPRKAWELIAAPLIISRDTPHDEAYQEAIKYMKMVGLSEDIAAVTRTCSLEAKDKELVSLEH